MLNDDLSRIGMQAGASPRIFRRAWALRRKMTQPELKLWEFLRTKPMGFKFRRQHPFDMYVLDFFCLKARISIEVDGTNHQRKSQILQDKFKTEVLNEYGIQEIRFTNDEVLNKFEHVKQQILNVLSQVCPNNINENPKNTF